MSKIQQQDIFINRELSWLEFNQRVLDLAKDKNVPLGERLKFASIYASNLDEFFMVRVGSLYDRSLLKEEEKENKTGMTALQQLHAIMPRAVELQGHCDKIIEKLDAALRENAYRRVNFEAMDKEDARFWKKYFLTELFPLLSPQIIDQRHPFPFLRGNEVYVGAMLRQKNAAQPLFGLIPVSGQMGRVIFVPVAGGVSYALVEDLVLHFADLVFGKKTLQGKGLFRVTRNADITVDEGMFDHDIDYRVIMSDLLKKRRKLAAVRMQIGTKTPQSIVAFLCGKLMLPPEQVVTQSAPLDLSVGFKLAARLSADGHNAMFYPVRRPIQAPSGFRLDQAAYRRDVLISYPYQSIRPFIYMLHTAAMDPDVISIKMTLYRVASQSKIIEALCAAAENGKEVVTIVELRARFDEQNNIDFSKQLEEAGCTVIYGLEDYKVHSKLCLITRKKDGALSYLSQIGTGNYNEKTSEQYTDLSLVTSDCAIGGELANVFNNLAIEQLTERASRLVVAPLCFKTVLMQEMDAEITAKRRGEEASIIIKCNSISDKDIIEKISEASCAGVPVQMIVRGICCVKAGLPGLTEHVTVRSIVGRYLEHSRIYSFGTPGAERMYIASGDFLTRNTQRRVEAGVQITDPDILTQLRTMLSLQLADNVNAHEMLPDGTYSKVKPQEGQPRVDSQTELYAKLETAWQKMAQEATAEPIALTAAEQKQVATPRVPLVPKENLWKKLRGFLR